MSESIITSDTQNNIPAEDIRRVKELRFKTTELLKGASLGLRKELLMYITNSTNDFFDALVKDIGETEARACYVTHILTGSTPPPNMPHFDSDGKGEAEMQRLYAYVESKVHKEKGV